ncbi:MAG: efflux RND transporter periplasmic adaptor subunit [Planctomycetes bacterium]|nr:efflux RND transporter periplasmic adaptor subunit [Planctomycetota bacterium]
MPWLPSRLAFAMLWTVLSAACSVPTACRADEPVPLPAPAAIEATTRPKEDVTLSFLYPGRITQFAVKEGDAVREGALLVQLDDGPDRIQLAQLAAEKDDRLGTQMAQARLAQKKSLLEQLERASARDAASPLELEQARLETRLAEFTLAREELDLLQATRKWEEASARIERMALRSPSAGKVEQVFVSVGETVDRLQRVVRIVSVDVLRIDVAVPLHDAGALRRDGLATVRFPGDGSPSATGKIVFVQAVADAASETLTVRVELPNAGGRPAGEHVLVQFNP